MNQINIGSLAVEKFYLGNSDSVQIYLGDVKLYPQGTPPTPTVRYAVTDDLTGYTATTYVDVYNKADDLWYKLNNNDGFEEYGVYGSSTGVSETYYDGKLSVVGDYEYQYSGNSWVNVGEVSANSTSYEITDADPYEYEGVELSTTFKIPVSDVEALGGFLDLTIRTQDGGRLTISTTRYRYMGNGIKNGTVTSDTTYYYYELPDIETVTISQIQYWDSTPVHIIVGSTELPVYYYDKPQPDFYRTYDSVETMNAETDLFDGKYGQIGDVIYKYENGWNTTNDKMMVGTAISGIRSFVFDVNKSYTPNAKAYVNGSSDENGLSQWIYQNNNTISYFTFDTGNGIGTSNNLVSYKVNNLDTSLLTVLNYSLLNGGFSNIKEVEIPTSVTSITYSIVFNIYNTYCPLKINILSQNDLQCITNWFSAENAELYIYNGIKIGNYTPIVPTKINNLKIYTPSSAVTSYRNDNYAKYYIPFIIPLDNGECDLSYSYMYSNYTNSSVSTVINFDAIAINSSMLPIKNGGWSRVMLGSNIENVYTGALSAGTTSSERWVQNFKISEGVQQIYQDAFSQGSSNSRITMNSTRYIDCQNKYIIEIPDSVIYIGNNAFRRYYTNMIDSSYEEIVIGSGVTSIGDYAFYADFNEYVSKHAKITVKATTPPTLGTNAFYEGSSKWIDAIYVPAESVDLYKSATNWNNYSSVIQAIPT